jgi:hypothetical protein
MPGNSEIKKSIQFETTATPLNGLGLQSDGTDLYWNTASLTAGETDTLDIVVNRGNTTSNTLLLTGETGFVASGNVEVTGNVTATIFYGDGGALSNTGTGLWSDGGSSNIYYNPSGTPLVGIANTNPQHALSIGTTLEVNDTSKSLDFLSDIIITSGITDENILIGQAIDPPVQIGNRSIVIGSNSGSTGGGIIGSYSVSLGANATRFGQGDQSVAVGSSAGGGVSGAGGGSQGDNAVAVGHDAGGGSQGDNAVAVGHDAGRLSQNAYSVAIGYGAGKYYQGSNSIIINASGSELNSSNVSNTYIKPIHSFGGIINGATSNVIFSGGYNYGVVYCNVQTGQICVVGQSL